MTELALAPHSYSNSDTCYVDAPLQITVAQVSPERSSELERAAVLLLRGAHRLGELATGGALAEPWPTNAPAGVRARFVANCLRELDTFLKGLLDQVAPPAPGRPHRHNTANRVHDVAHPRNHSGASLAILGTDIDRLRALGRSRACLWHCHGLVRCPDQHGGAWMTAGWHAPASTRLRRYAIGERLTPDGTDLTSVGIFYHQLAHKIADA